MSHLTLKYLPELIEDPEDKDARSIPVMGETVVKPDLVKALLQHGTYDRYYFLCGSADYMEQGPKRLAQYPANGRAEIILVDDYYKLKHIDRMALFTQDSSIHFVSHFRTSQGRTSWPAVGVTHTLSTTKLTLPGIVQGILGDIYNHDALICTSQAARKALQNIISSICNSLSQTLKLPVSLRAQLPVIPLAVDANVLSPRDRREARSLYDLPYDHMVFLYLGRLSLSFKADLFTLILNFSRFLASGRRKATLILAGADAFNLAPRFRAFAKELGIEQHLLVLPNVEAEVKRWLYSASDAFLVMSDSVQESFGLTVIEAMSMGLPVIGSDWNGYRETIEDGKTGLLVPTRWADCLDEVSRLAVSRNEPDTHRMLAQAVSIDTKILLNYMEAMYDNPQLRREMGEAGRRRVLLYYNWPAVIRQYEALWEDLIDLGRVNVRLEEVEFKHSLFSYDYLRAFGHYATGVITDKEKLRLSPLGKDLLQGNLPAQALQYTQLAAQADLSLKITAALLNEPEIQIGSLIADMGREFSGSREEAFRHIARLIKYGILEIAE